MPPQFGEPVSPLWGGIPPHMSQRDFVIWERYRRSVGLPFSRLFYDVAVGRGANPEVEVDENVLEAWRRITRQRIDAVGETPESWTIIEIRADAGASAIGALKVYGDLWREDPPDGRPVSLWLMTDTFPESLLGSLQSLPARLLLV